MEVPLGDNDPEALAVILRIVHHQHDWAPTSLDEDRLYQVAILCDKYDIRRALETWLDIWLIPYPDGQEALVQAGKWLFMTYAFDLRALFTLCSKLLIMDKCINVLCTR